MSNDPVPGFDQAEHYVLCVDDDADFLTSLEFFLPEKVNRDPHAPVWYRFLFIHDPREALGTLKDLTESRETVAMIITDQKMPEMKGTELLEQAKTVAPDSVRVLLTGNAGLESAICAINKQLLDKYLTKPVEDQNDFVVSVQHLLEAFQMRRTIADQNRIIRSMYNFSNVLNAISETHATFDYIVTFTRDALRCEQVALLIAEEETLALKAAKGFPEDMMRTLRIPLVEHAFNEMFQPRKGSVAKNLEDVPYLNVRLTAPHKAQFHTPLLYAALTGGRHAMGVLSVGKRRDAQPFANTDFQYLTHIADASSIAIQNQLHRAQFEHMALKTQLQAGAPRGGGRKKSRSPASQRVRKAA